MNKKLYEGPLVCLRIMVKKDVLTASNEMLDSWFKDYVDNEENSINLDVSIGGLGK